jgi:hypothetical protein
MAATSGKKPTRSQVPGTTEIEKGAAKKALGNPNAFFDLRFTVYNLQCSKFSIMSVESTGHSDNRREEEPHGELQNIDVWDLYRIAITDRIHC